jgi:ribose transport system ATP-binding protein
LTQAPAIAARGLSKEFNGRRVLDNVDIDLGPGEIHGLVGQNGSGKSTLIKILAGYHAPEPGGELSIDGNAIRLPLRSDDPARIGISFVHQDLGFLQSGTVVENFRIGRYATGFAGRISWRRERRETAAALREFGLSINPERIVSTLTPVEQAMVAIARSVDQLRRYRRSRTADDDASGSQGSGLLVLDEPTSYLPRDGVDRLFSAMRTAANAGSAILFVSHRLTEVLSVTDRLTVIRDGKKVGTFDTATMTEEALIGHLLGFSLETLYPEPHDSTNEVLVSARDVCGGGVEDFSVDLHRGEIVGLTGLTGMGQERVPYVLFGAEPGGSGSIRIDQTDLSISSLTPGVAIRHGFALLPGDRTGESGSPAATAAENMMLPSFRRLFRSGVLLRKTEIAESRGLMHAFNVKPADPTLAFSAFSGGNQQKALVGKWVATSPKCFLMIEPTQGVDVGAKRHIFEAIRRLANDGIPVVIASVEYKDLAHVCDRVIVFRDGKAITELHGSSLTEDRIVEQCFAGRIGDPISAHPQQEETALP